MYTAGARHRGRREEGLEKRTFFFVFEDSVTNSPGCFMSILMLYDAQKKTSIVVLVTPILEVLPRKVGR